MTARQVLHGWKQIGAYLGRGVRTSQRYETQYRLPVHRPAGKDRSAVFAFADELDAWLAGTPKRVTGQALQNPKHPEAQRPTLALIARAKMNREQAQAVRQMAIAQTDRVRAMIRKVRQERAARNRKKQ